MAFPSLTKDDIQAHTAGGSFKRGRQYLEDGAVQSLKQTDEHTLKAKVQGSDVHPYVVTIQFDADHVTDIHPHRVFQHVTARHATHWFPVNVRTGFNACGCHDADA